MGGLRAALWVPDGRAETMAVVFKVAATVALAGACATIVLSRRRAGLTEAYMQDAADLFELGRQVERATAKRG